MNYKNLFTKIALAKASEQEYAMLHAFLDSDDEAALNLCQYDIPVITALICKDDALSTKGYALKYANLMPLYNGMPIGKYVDTIFGYHYEEIIPMLDEDTLKQISADYAFRIEFINDLDVQVQSIENRIKNRTADRQKAKDDGKELSKKTLKKMQDNDAEDKKSLSVLKARINYLTQMWGNPVIICERINAAIASYADTQSKKLETLLADKKLEQQFSAALSSAAGPSEDVSVLVEKVRTLEADLAALRSCISSQQTENSNLQTRISNLQAYKKDAEERAEQYEMQTEQLKSECAKLKANCDAYNSILLGLSGQIVDAIYNPVCELERIVFEAEDEKSTQSPRDIANWLKNPINALRDNFEKIELNASAFDNLSKSYSISIASVDDLGSWECRTPVAYDDELHTCKVVPTEFVLLRDRGFLYKNNLSQVKTKKADVIPYTPATPEATEHDSAKGGEAE